MTTTVRTPNQNQQIVDLQSVAMGEDGTGVLVQDTDTSYRARVSYTDFKEEGAGWWQVGERESNLGRITLIRASLIKAKPLAKQAAMVGLPLSLLARFSSLFNVLQPTGLTIEGPIVSARWSLTLPRLLGRRGRMRGPGDPGVLQQRHMRCPGRLPLRRGERGPHIASPSSSRAPALGSFASLTDSSYVVAGESGACYYVACFRAPSETWQGKMKRGKR